MVRYNKGMEGTSLTIRIDLPHEERPSIPAILRRLAKDLEGLNKSGLIRLFNAKGDNIGEAYLSTHDRGQE